MFKFLKKPTREEEIQKRIDQLFYLTISDLEISFTSTSLTPLEKVQVTNSVRNRINKHLEDLKSKHYETSTECIQTAKEIKEAIAFIK